MSNPLISVVIPVYRSEESLVELSERLTKSIELITNEFEVLFVNDGSPDNSWQVITQIAHNDPRFVGLRLSRNFGQHAAIHAGLTESRGDWVVVMDCDLQDRPEEIPHLYSKALEGYDQVVAIREVRKDSLLKRSASVTFFKTLSFLTDQKLDYREGNFGIYDSRVIRALLAMGDRTRTFSVLIRWVGFSRTGIVVQHDPRQHGNSTYSVRRQVGLAVRTIAGSSDKPLRLTIGLGFFVSAISFLLGLLLGVRRVIFGVAVVGWTSTLVVTSFLLGTVIACIGIVGVYVGQIFEQSKMRPIYIIESTTLQSEQENR